MVRNVVIAAFLSLALAFSPQESAAQLKKPDRDTVCVPVVQLQRMRKEVTELRRRDSVNADIKENLRSQVRELETVVRQDSVVITTLEKELDFRKQQIDLRDERIGNLESRLRKQEVRKWVYFVGGAATVVLGAWAAGQAN